MRWALMFGLVMALGLVSAPKRAHAELLISEVGFSGNAIGGGAVQQTIGYRFRPEVDLEVTGLALFDFMDDGIPGVDGYTLRLWDDTGVELASAVVPSGTVAPLVSGFRTVDLASPVAITAGTIYRVSADLGDFGAPNELLQGTNGTTADVLLTIDPRFTLLQNTGTAASTLEADWVLRGDNGTFPTEPDNFVQLMGPNVIVPEPSSLALLGLGTLLVARRRR